MKSHSQSGQMNKLEIRTPGISPAFINLRDKPVYIKGVRGRCKLARKDSQGVNLCCTYNVSFIHM
nr:MAG TPA: hypothetical protein [Caudoviricetes sp.]